MSEQSNQALLREKVIEKSRARDWEQAKKEWELEFIFDNKAKCICNHFIIENCRIKNKHNGSRLTVGNVCVNHFGEDELNVDKKCRSSLRRLQRNVPNAKANEELVELARRLNILSENEAKAYNARRRKHQDPLRDKWNQFIRYGFHPNRPCCECGEYAKPKRSGDNGPYFYGCLFKQDDDRNCGFREDI
jgi:hypothetical protein